MLIGHKTQWKFLCQIAENSRVAQAMIFSGQDSLGKKKVALEFVKLLSCQEKDFKKKPCQKCLSCKIIEKNQHPDLTLIAPEKKEIQISQIRDLQKNLSFKSQISSFKFAIIDRAETLNSQAQNCFLKTLEEPKGDSLLILVTSQPKNLFRTIYSRCQILKFYPLSFKEIKEYFKSQLSSSELEKIFIISQGKPGKIIEFLNNPQKSFSVFKSFKEIENLLKLNLSEKFSFSKNFFEGETNEENLVYFLENFENYLRIVFLKKVGIKNEVLDSLSLKVPQDYSFFKIKKVIDSIEDLRILSSRTNINQKLAFENLMITLG